MTEEGGNRRGWRTDNRLQRRQGGERVGVCELWMEGGRRKLLLFFFPVFIMSAVLCCSWTKDSCGGRGEKISD